MTVESIMDVELQQALARSIELARRSASRLQLRRDVLSVLVPPPPSRAQLCHQCFFCSKLHTGDLTAASIVD